MRKILLILMFTVSILSVKAQENTFGGGYRGFADLGYTIGIGDYDFGRLEISTTHGYQVNSYFLHYHKYSISMAPFSMCHWFQCVIGYRCFYAV